MEAPFGLKEQLDSSDSSEDVAQLLGQVGRVAGDSSI